MAVLGVREKPCAGPKVLSNASAMDTPAVVDDVTRH